jgi:hypothetical protein
MTAIALRDNSSRAWLRSSRARRFVVRSVGNSYLRAVKIFANWLRKDKRTADYEAATRRKSQFLPYVTEDGAYADFHAFRHTYISGIVASGASVKTAQTLARHSTVELTVGRYAHARLHDLQGAVESLPSLVPSPPVAPATARANGADGRRSDNSWGQMRGQLGGSKRQLVAQIGNCVSECVEIDSSPEPDAQVITVSAFGNKKATPGKAWQKAEGTGLEPATGKPAPDFESDAEGQIPRENHTSAYPCQYIASSDKNMTSDLQAVVIAWPGLSDAIKTTIMLLVRAGCAQR